MLMNNEALCATWTPRMLSILRMITGLLFLQHGTTKFFGIPLVPSMQNIPYSSPVGIGGFFELIGGALITIGLFTRPVAFLLAGEMAVAYFYAHAPRSFYPLVNNGELAVLFCFVFLYIFMAGAGPWSLDAMMRKRV